VPQVEAAAEPLEGAAAAQEEAVLAEAVLAEAVLALAALAVLVAPVAAVLEAVVGAGAGALVVAATKRVIKPARASISCEALAGPRSKR
jgi:hypothetical protein